MPFREALCYPSSLEPFYRSIGQELYFVNLLQWIVSVPRSRYPIAGIIPLESSQFLVYLLASTFGSKGPVVACWYVLVLRAR